MERSRSCVPENARCYLEELPVVQRQLANSVSTIQAISLAVLVRRAGQVATSAGGKAGGPLLSQDGRASPVRYVSYIYRDDPTSISDRLMVGGRVHIDSLKGCRNVVLSDVIQGLHFLVKLLSTYCVSPACEHFGISSLSGGLAQGWQRATETR